MNWVKFRRNLKKLKNLTGLKQLGHQTSHTRVYGEESVFLHANSRISLRNFRNLVISMCSGNCRICRLLTFIKEWVVYSSLLFVWVFEDITVPSFEFYKCLLSTQYHIIAPSVFFKASISSIFIFFFSLSVCLDIASFVSSSLPILHFHKIMGLNVYWEMGTIFLKNKDQHPFTTKKVLTSCVIGNRGFGPPKRSGGSKKYSTTWRHHQVLYGNL